MQQDLRLLIGIKDKEISSLSHSFIDSLKIMITTFCKIPPYPSLPKGGIIPLFGKEG
jgi:hypothetical protein